MVEVDSVIFHGLQKPTTNLKDEAKLVIDAYTAPHNLPDKAFDAWAAIRAMDFTDLHAAITTTRAAASAAKEAGLETVGLVLDVAKGLRDTTQQQLLPRLQWYAFEAASREAERRAGYAEQGHFGPVRSRERKRDKLDQQITNIQTDLAEYGGNPDKIRKLENQRNKLAREIVAHKERAQTLMERVKYLGEPPYTAAGEPYPAHLEPGGFGPTPPEITAATAPDHHGPYSPQETKVIGKQRRMDSSRQTAAKEKNAPWYHHRSAEEAAAVKKQELDQESAHKRGLKAAIRNRKVEQGVGPIFGNTFNTLNAAIKFYWDNPRLVFDPLDRRQVELDRKATQAEKQEEGWKLNGMYGNIFEVRGKITSLTTEYGLTGREYRNTNLKTQLNNIRVDMEAFADELLNHQTIFNQESWKSFYRTQAQKLYPNISPSELTGLLIHVAQESQKGEHPLSHKNVLTIIEGYEQQIELTRQILGLRAILHHMPEPILISVTKSSAVNDIDLGNRLAGMGTLNQDQTDTAVNAIIESLLSDNSGLSRNLTRSPATPPPGTTPESISTELKRDIDAIETIRERLAEQFADEILRTSPVALQATNLGTATSGLIVHPTDHISLAPNYDPAEIAIIRGDHTAWAAAQEAAIAADATLTTKEKQQKLIDDVYKPTIKRLFTGEPSPQTP